MIFSRVQYEYIVNRIGDKHTENIYKAGCLNVLSNSEDKKNKDCLAVSGENKHFQCAETLSVVEKSY